MLKYYKEYFSDYAYSDWVQTLTLIGFVVFFVGMAYTVYKRPKSYYSDVENLPLEDDDNLFDQTK